MDYLKHLGNSFLDASQTHLLSKIYAYEKDISKHGWPKATVDSKEQGLQEEILRLRRLQYYARYGDYAQKIAHSLGDTTRTHETGKWEKLSGVYSWSQISGQLHTEKACWEKIRTIRKPHERGDNLCRVFRMYRKRHKFRSNCMGCPHIWGRCTTT